MPMKKESDLLPTPVVDFAVVRRHLIAEGRSEGEASVIIGDMKLRAAYRQSLSDVIGALTTPADHRSP